MAACERMEVERRPLAVRRSQPRRRPGFRGPLREVTPQERLVWTSEWDGMLFTNQRQGLLDDPIGEVHSRCKQNLDYWTGNRKKALSFPAEDQSQGSDEGHYKDTRE